MTTETQKPTKLILPLTFVTTPPIPIEASLDEETQAAIRRFYLERYARLIVAEIKHRRKQKSVI